MAFIKPITTRGVDASYIKLTAYRWDTLAREASALFALFVDRDHCERCKRGEDQPLLPIVAKLRLAGAEFDTYVGNETLAESAANAGTDAVAHLYAAAKAVSLASRKVEGMQPTHVVSDFGSDIFADARAG